MHEPREYEVKLSFDPADLDAIANHPVLPATSRRTDHLVATYFDTPDAALRRQRIGLRVRRSARGTVHTLKRSHGSRIDRDEWEWDDDAAVPDRDRLCRTPLRDFFVADGRLDALEPRFTTAVTRTTIALPFAGADVEVAIDEGTIRAADRVLPVHEIEIELKDGARDGVLALARRLAGDLPLTLSLASKAERGHALADGQVAEPVKALDVAVSETATMAVAFESVVQACLHALTHNAALIDGPQRFEATHKTRIAIRRLRAAIKLFKPALRARALAAIGEPLLWASTELGAARDADVFQLGFDAAAREGEVPGAHELAEIMRARQEASHARLKASMAGPKWRLLLLDLLALSGDGIRQAQRDKACRPFLRRRVERDRAALHDRSRRIERLPPPALHALRKRAKMLRYNLDIFADAPTIVGRPRAVTRLSKALQKLQEALGAIHDAEAARETLHGVIVESPPPPGEGGRWARAAYAAGILASRPGQTGKALRRAAEAGRILARPL